ncbi:MAG: hypothetical protein V4565_00515 [Bacteroidota bacterium]
MKHLFFLILIAINLNLLAQAKYSTVSEDFVLFHENVSAAERMYRNDSILQAYAKFDNAFANYKGQVNPGHYFRAAFCAIKIKEEFKGLHFLEKAIVNGYEIDSLKKRDIVFYNQNTKKEYLDNINKWEEKRNASRNMIWQEELIKSAAARNKSADAKYKEALAYCLTCMKSKSCSKTAPDYLSKYKVVRDRMKADSLAAVVLLNSIQQNGFPSVKLVGSKASEIARNTLLNYDADKKNERLDNILFKALQDGNISPEFYASLIDRRNVLNGLAPEFYEPISGYEKTIGKDLAPANQKRSSIGLHPIKIASASAPKTKDSAMNKKVSTQLYDY